jgi:hypothetical protein
LEDFKIGRQIIHTVKYADDLVLLAKEEKVLQDMIDKLIEIGRCYGMEMNVEKTKVMRLSRQPLSVKIMIDQKQLEKVESFKYLGSILTKDGRFTCEIKCMIAMAKAAFNKKKTLRINCLVQRVIEEKIQGGIQEDKEEDVGSYWMTLRKGEDTLI